MAAEAQVAIKIRGDSTQLQSDLKKGGRALDAFENKAKAMQSQMLKVGAASAAAGVAMATALYKQQAGIIDRLAKTADALGVTTENLQALRHMAGLAGVESEELDKAIQRMSKGLGDAARKGGAAADALDDIGVNIKDVLKLSADKQMEVLAKALQKVENHTEKASIASDLFGRNGLRMLKVLQQLESEGLKPTIDSIDAMGASLSRVDAAKVEDANDAVAKAMEAASGLAKELTVTLAPIVQKVADAFTNWVKESGGLREKLAELQPYFSALVSAGKIMAVVYGVQIVVAMSAYAASTYRSIIANAALVKSMTVVAGVARALRIALALLGGPIGIIAAVAASLFFFKSSAEQTTVAVESLKNANYDLGRSFTNLTTKQAKAEIVDVENAMSGLADKIQNLKAGIDQLNESDNTMWSPENFNFDTSEMFGDEVLIKAEAQLEALQKMMSEYNTRLGMLGLASEGMITPISDEEVEEVDVKLKDIESKYQGYYERMQKAQTEANAKLLEDTKSWNAQREAEDEASLQRKRDLVTGIGQMFGNLSSLMGSENKKLFLIGKAAAIAQATIDGISAAVSSFKFGASIGGPVLGAAFAAASAVSTGMMIKQIASQQPNGSAQTANVSGGNVQASASQAQQPNGTLIVQGLTPEISGIAEQLLDYQRQGGRVVLEA